MSISDDVINDMPAEKFDEIAKRVRDGDVLLCAAKDPFSRLIGWSTKSPWSHVAIAYRWPSLGRVMVFESVQHIGVRAVPLSKFVSQSSTGRKPYPGQIILARHIELASKRKAQAEKATKTFADFAVDRLGDPFAAGEILKIGARICIGRIERQMPKLFAPKNEFICSEYAAKCFADVGIKILWDGLGFIAPVDFARDPKIKAIGRFKTG